MTFFNRKKELSFFSSQKDLDEKRMIVLYGRRRVGKTALLKRAFPDAAYFFVDTRSSETLLKDFSGNLIDGVYDSWEVFFRNLLKEQAFILFDEFQNFSKVDKSIFSIFQKVWDETDSTAKVVFCGSYVGMMKKIFMDSKEPLFGRSDFNIQLKPFSFPATFEMLKTFGYSFDEVVIWYSLLGGIPHYLWRLKNKNEFYRELKELFFSDFAPLKEEGKNLLIGEFGSQHPGYFSVLQAISDKELEMGEIADKSSLKNNTAAKYVNELVNYYDILEPVRNFFSTNKRGKRYRIKDNFLAFWFRYIYSNYDIVEFNPDSAFRFAKENLMSRVGFVFEDIVKGTLPLLFNAGHLPFLPDRIGKSWGKVPNEKGESYEIDIVGEKENRLLVIECKWREKQVNDKQINRFLKKCSYLKTKKEIIPVFINKSGFKNPDRHKDQLILLDKDDMLDVYDLSLRKNVDTNIDDYLQRFSKG